VAKGLARRLGGGMGSGGGVCCCHALLPPLPLPLFVPAAAKPVAK
jgi:hypothetical protein